MKACGTGASPSASAVFGGDTGLMASFFSMSGERAITGETGALPCGVRVSELMR